MTVATMVGLVSVGSSAGPVTDNDASGYRSQYWSAMTRHLLAMSTR